MKDENTRAQWVSLGDIIKRVSCDNVLCLDSLQKAITIHRHTPSARPSFNDNKNYNQHFENLHLCRRFPYSKQCQCFTKLTFTVGNQNTGTYIYWSSKYLLSLLRSLHYYWTSISTTRTKESSCFLPPQQLGNSLGHKVEQGGPLTTASVQFPSYRPNAQFPASELYKVEFGWRSEEISTSSNLVAQRTWHKQQTATRRTYLRNSTLERYILSRLQSWTIHRHIQRT